MRLSTHLSLPRDQVTTRGASLLTTSTLSSMLSMANGPEHQSPLTRLSKPNAGQVEAELRSPRSLQLTPCMAQSLYLPNVPRQVIRLATKCCIAELARKIETLEPERARLVDMDERRPKPPCPLRWPPSSSELKLSFPQVALFMGAHLQVLPGIVTTALPRIISSYLQSSLQHRLQASQTLLPLPPGSSVCNSPTWETTSRAII